MNKVCPFYVLHCRKFYTEMMNKEFNRAHKLLFDLLSKVKYIALTSDAWSSRIADSYTTITAHLIRNGQLKDYVLETKNFGRIVFKLI